MLYRATQSFPSPSASCTDQTRQRSAISRQKIIWARPGLSPPLIDPTPSLVLLARKSETCVCPRTYPLPALWLILAFTYATVSQAVKTESKDDRPTENVSYAATNLVKPGLQSRRQQSEPPTNRNNVFPPTPPPENDRPSRGASVRSGRGPMPAKLTIQTQELNRKYEKAGSPESKSARPGRSASATPARQYSQRDGPQRARTARPIDEEVEDAYPDELYDMYSAGGARASRSSRGQASRQRQQQRYIEEEEGSDYDDGSFDEGDFEMISTNRRGPGSVSSGGRAASRRPEIRKFRVKVHAADDVRYIMIGGACEYPDLVERIRDKFELRRKFKVKVKDDDGDMITVGDQDDLDMAVSSAKSQARKQRLDVGKMEVCHPPHPSLHMHQMTNNLCTALGERNIDLYPFSLRFDSQPWSTGRMLPHRSVRSRGL